MEITISGQNPKHLKLIENLAKELGLNVSEPEKTIRNGKQTGKSLENSQKLFELMEEMAESSAFSSIKDPAEWQRKQRKDRSISGRN